MTEEKQYVDSSLIIDGESENFKGTKKDTDLNIWLDFCYGTSDGNSTCLYIEDLNLSIKDGRVHLSTRSDTPKERIENLNLLLNEEFKLFIEHIKKTMEIHKEYL